MFTTLHATSQKCAILNVVPSPVNYRLFAHSDISYRSNGENDNAVCTIALTSLCD